MSAVCHDCQRPYGDEYGFPDLVVAHEVWNKHLSPSGDGSGLLCPSCMCKRAYDAGISSTCARFTSGPFAATEEMQGLPSWYERQLTEQGETIRALREALTECADDLEAEVHQRYGYPDVHPAMQRKYERDMEPVTRARALSSPTP